MTLAEATMISRISASLAGSMSDVPFSAVVRHRCPDLAETCGNRNLTLAATKARKISMLGSTTPADPSPWLLPHALRKKSKDTHDLWLSICAIAVIAEYRLSTRHQKLKKGRGNMQLFTAYLGRIKRRGYRSIVLAATVLLIGLFGAFATTPFARQPSGSQTFPPISPVLPYDVDVAQVRELVGKFGREDEQKVLEAHRLFGTLAWQAFIALNWPANDRGEPEVKRGIGDNNQWRVWDHWRPASSIFLADGARPQPWTGERAEASGLRSLANTHRPNSISGPNGSFQAFTGPLVDQHGKWARFEIRVNREEFDYIVKNDLYSQDGQAAFSQKETNNRVDFPVNGASLHGAIEIKLAWKELAPTDDASRFYTHDIDVTPIEPGSKPKRIHAGLVGMHIAMRTKSSPEWIWSTFEQIDNVRSNPEPAGKQSTPSFVDLASKGPFNVLPPKNGAYVDGKLVPASGPTATTWIESLTTTPVQVQRVVLPTSPGLNPRDRALGMVTAALNGEVQAMLREKGTVFQYYELIDVQWPLHPSLPSVAGGEGSAPQSLQFKTPGQMIPTFLINTTMETYFQRGLQPAGGSEQDNRLAPPSRLLSDAGNAQVADFGGNSLTDSTMVNATESCVGCHFSAGITTMFRAGANGVRTAVQGENATFGDNGSANYSWMLQLEAQPAAPASKP
jgi:hypothetical protein